MNTQSLENLFSNLQVNNNNINIKNIFLFLRINENEETNEYEQENTLRNIVKYFIEDNYNIIVIKIYNYDYIQLPQIITNINPSQNDIIMFWSLAGLSKTIDDAIKWLYSLYSQNIIIYSLFEDITFHSNPSEFVEAIINPEPEDYGAFDSIMTHYLNHYMFNTTEI